MAAVAGLRCAGASMVLAACCGCLGGEGGVLAGTPIEGQLQKLLQQGRGKPSSLVGASARLRASLLPCFPLIDSRPPNFACRAAARSCTLTPQTPRRGVNGIKKRERKWNGKKRPKRGRERGTAKKKTKHNGIIETMKANESVSTPQTDHSSTSTRRAGPCRNASTAAPCASRDRPTPSATAARRRTSACT